MPIHWKLRVTRKEMFGSDVFFHNHITVTTRSYAIFKRTASTVARTKKKTATIKLNVSAETYPKSSHKACIIITAKWNVHSVNENRRQRWWKWAVVVNKRALLLWLNDRLIKPSATCFTAACIKTSLESKKRWMHRGRKIA